MKRTVFACLLVALFAAIGPAVTIGAGNADNAHACRENWEGWGFKNNGACVSFFARGGTLVTTEPRLELVDGVFPCSGPRGCWLALDGEGLQPGSEVIVGDPAVAYGASFVVQSDGTVAVEGIFLIGTCSTRPSSDFIARGVGADGLPIESEVVTIDHTSNMCP